MPEPAFISAAHVAVVGLGLMGGSLAMALHGKCAALLGIDSDEGALSLALGRGTIDKASTDPAELLPEADIIVLAAPIHAILATLQSLPGLHPGEAFVLDLGSTKKDITLAMAQLPGRFDVIGGHPICGKEKSGLENADASLFRGAPFVLTPLPTTTPAAKAIAVELVQAVGGRPLWLDAETHDRWISFTSHLPYMLALALATSTPLEAAPLVGPGFRSTSRVAATPASIMLDILATNRSNILDSVDLLREQLDILEACLRGEDWIALEQLLLAGAARQATLSVGQGTLSVGTIQGERQ
jgi:prephenate dehydrogenase